MGYWGHVSQRRQGGECHSCRRPVPPGGRWVMGHGQTGHFLAGSKSPIQGCRQIGMAEADLMTGLLSQIGRLRAQRQRKTDHEPLKGAHHRPLERRPGQYVSCSLTSPPHPFSFRPSSCSRPVSTPLQRSCRFSSISSGAQISPYPLHLA